MSKFICYRINDYQMLEFWEDPDNASGILDFSMTEVPDEVWEDFREARRAYINAYERMVDLCL